MKMPTMELSEPALRAIHLMRRFQSLEEQYREAAAKEYELARVALETAYAKTNRESLGNISKALHKRALEDPTRKELIGDEQFFRELAVMYAAIAQVELSLDEARERERYRRIESGHDIRNADPSRAE